MSYFAWNDGRFIFHNDTTASIGIGVNGYDNPQVLVYQNKAVIKNDLFVSGNIYAANLTGSTINTGSLVTTSSFNSYTASQDFKNTTFATTSSVTALSQSLYFTDTTQSVNIATNTANIVTLTSKTGSFAITGSNTFRGNQIVSGTFFQSGSNTLGNAPQLAGTWIKNRVVIGGTSGGDGPPPRLWISGSDGALTNIGRSYININSTKVAGIGANYIQYADDTSAVTFTQGIYNPNDNSNDIELFINTDINGTSFNDYDQTISDYSNWLTLGPNDGVTIPQPTFTRGLVVSGSIVSTAGFAQEQLITNQSISAGSDTVVTFNHSDFDPSGWYNGEFFYFQPTIAGTYQVSYGVNFESVASGTGQINTQIRLNGTTVNINQSNLNVGYNQTLSGTYLVQMNGTTDTLDLSAYSSAATTILASNGTFFNIKLL